MVLFGAGGHAKVIINILELNSMSIDRIYDENINIKTILNYPISLPSKNTISENTEMIICIGDNRKRKDISLEYTAKYSRAIHPGAILDPTVTIDDGTVIMANVAINSSTKIGKHVIINTSASVDHDCIIEDYVHISPNVTLCGDISISEGTHIGAGAVVIPGIKIGKWSVIGAGSVVINDIPDHVVAVGNPAKIIKSIVNHEK